MSDAYFALLIATEGQRVEENVMSALKHSGVLQMCYAFKSRVKSDQSLLEKKARKSEFKPGYDLHDIVDVIGIRLVTLSRDDIEEIFQSLLRVIMHEGMISPNPFQKNKVEEITIYSPNPYDPIAINIDRITKGSGLAININSHVSHESFLSLHIIARLSHNLDKVSDKPYHFPVEFQIRTVFEDVWGELDHKYGYIIRSGKIDASAMAHPAGVLRHLKLLKKLTDTCAEYADVIRAEAIPVETIQAEYTDTTSTDAELFSALRLTPDTLAQYKRASKLRLDAHNEKDTGLVTFVDKFILAACAYKEIAGDGNFRHDSDINTIYLYYYSKMSEAGCLFATNQKDKAQAALAIYQKLDILFNDSPLLKLRLAQVYSRLGFNELSLEHYKLSNICLTEFERAGSNFSVKLLKLDHEYLKQYLPKLHGFELWKKSKDILEAGSYSKAMQRSLLEQAYTITQTALPFNTGKNRLIIHNNLLSYAIDYLSIEPSSEDILDFIPDVNFHLNEILTEVRLESCEDLEMLDTLAKAYNYLEDLAKSEQIVDRIMSLVLDPTKNLFLDRNIMFEIAQDAYEMKQKIQSA